MSQLKTIKDFNLCGKDVIMRVDFNVPVKDGKITDDNRIRSSVPTIEYALSQGANVILMSHMGKIKKEEDKAKNSLAIVVPVLEDLLNTEVNFIPYTSGSKLLEELKVNRNRVVLLENTRYEDLNEKRESKNNEDLAKFWASMGDIAIFDGFGVSHRDHASSSGMFKYIPSGAGFLVQMEVEKINGIILEDTHPFTILMGGSKVSDKIPIIKNLINKCDNILIGGAMAFTFLKALGYNVGKSLVEDECVDFCKEIMSKYPNKITLPLDVVTNNLEVKSIKEINDDEMGFDIGPKTINLFKDNLSPAKRVVINGTMGKNEDEEFAVGTNEVFSYLGNCKAKVLVGGGDTAAAVHKLGIEDKFYHVSTGGGATISYLGGEYGEIFEHLKNDNNEKKTKKRY